MRPAPLSSSRLQPGPAWPAGLRAACSTRAAARRRPASAVPCRRLPCCCVIATLHAPSITRSSTRSSSSSRARRLVHDPALADHQHPVGEPEHLGHLAGHQQHRHAVVGEPADQRVELARAPDVDAAGGLVEQQHVAAVQQPAGEHRLLLVAAGQRAHRAGGVGRPDVEPRGDRARPRSARRRGRASRPGRTGAARAARRCGTPARPAAAPWLLRSSGARPIPARTAAGTVPGAQRLPVDPDRAGGGLAGAVDGLQDLRAARADQPGEPDDLAGAHGERDVGELAGAGSGPRPRSTALVRPGSPGAAGRRTRRAAGHQRDDLGGRGVAGGQVAGDGAAVLEHGDPVADLRGSPPAGARCRRPRRRRR